MGYKLRVTREGLAMSESLTMIITAFGTIGSLAGLNYGLISWIKNDTKSDIQDLKKSMDNFKTEIRSDMANFKSDINSSLESFRSEIRNDIEILKTEMHADIRDFHGRLCTLEERKRKE